MNMAACKGGKDVQYASLRTYFGRTPRGRAGHVPPWATIFITNRSPARGWQSNTSCVSMFLAQRDRARAGPRARARGRARIRRLVRSALHGPSIPGSPPRTIINKPIVLFPTCSVLFPNSRCSRFILFRSLSFSLEDREIFHSSKFL